MKRLFPAPLLSAALAALWLMLNQSVSPGQLLLAVIVGLVMPALMAPLRPAGPPVRHPLVLARLILNVGHDVIVSALQVGAGVLHSGRQLPQSEFVVIPLDLHDRHGLAALAMITAVVPGTIWCELSPDRNVLLLHVFNVGDVDVFVRHYKERYELPLKEILE